MESTISLEPQGITVKRILRNPAPAKLYEEALRNEKGSAISSTGALVAMSGKKTGRSPSDKRIVDDPKVEIRLSATTANTGIPPSSQDTDLFRALVKNAVAQFPGAEVTPYLFQAGTDAGAWRSRGVPVYGVYPYPITADELTRMHGNDERVAIESLKQGTEFIYRTLVEVAAR